MATVNSGIREDANFLNLKEIAQKQVKSEVNNMLVTGENIIQCFQTVRDQVVFTDKRGAQIRMIRTRQLTKLQQQI